MRDDTSIRIKCAEQGLAVIMWNRGDYLKEAEYQLSDGNASEKVEYEDVGSPLISIVKSHVARVKLRGDIPNLSILYVPENSYTSS